MSEQNKILLMIEPNDDKFAAFSSVLQNEGLDIKRAVTAAEATKVIEDTMPMIDFVLLDWTLPDANGFAYAQKLRQNELLHATQFIICTKTMSEDDLVLLSELDIYHWFNSNNDAAALLDKVNAAKNDAEEVSAIAKAIKKFDRAVSKEDIKYAKDLLNKDDLEKHIRSTPRYHYCLGEYYILLREPQNAVELLTETLKSKPPKGDNIKTMRRLAKPIACKEKIPRHSKFLKSSLPKVQKTFRIKFH